MIILKLKFFLFSILRGNETEVLNIEDFFVLLFTFNSIDIFSAHLKPMII
jgi:hypothetical protein